MAWLDGDALGGQALVVAGRVLQRCVLANPEANLADVEVVSIVPGSEPEAVTDDDGVIVQRIAIPVELQGSAPATGPIYWTGTGWVDETSGDVSGPPAGILYRMYARRVP